VTTLTIQFFYRLDALPATQPTAFILYILFCVLFGRHSIAHFDLVWVDRAEADPTEDAAYLGQFMEAFEGRMLSLIEQAVEQQSSVTCDAHVVEILQHLTVCRQRCQVLHTPP